ncbi:uncharacterized protein RCC_04977 [Ramularia collo-cygni]|uniref:Uncharacterized protein n=1 Tax=Ramularia collo-cygni TaxID=112498 RepID=A0A2D3USC1_9PEZI|nr:uncharacterized protein RCC_04977 [Ramularia collo-cygni]CZT19131.1 uncharacterized protein RCC_04977 [Ramularia collo-cygni]
MCAKIEKLLQEQPEEEAGLAEVRHFVTEYEKSKGEVASDRGDS